MADNTNVNVMCEGKEALRDFLKFWEHENPHVMGWSEKMVDAHKTWHTKKEDVEELPTLILSWFADKADNKMPYKMPLSETVDLVWGWLEAGPWPDQPDHDGSNGKGWFAFTDFWGHVGEDHYAVIGFQRCWALYGK